MEFISDINANSPARLHSLYLSTDVVRQTIVEQNKVIRKIAYQGSCLISGRAANYVFRDYENIIRIFIYAHSDYHIRCIMEVYGDSYDDTKKNIHRSDEERASYYKNISALTWGSAHNYDLLIYSSIVVEKCADII